MFTSSHLLPDVVYLNPESQWRHTMASINLYKKNRTWAFFAGSHRFHDLQKYCDLQNIGQGHDIQKAKWRHSMANTSLYTNPTGVFIFC